MAMQAPNTQILPIAPTSADLGALTKWAQDLTRTLQQNLGNIARKANEAVPAISPLTANLDAGGFNITNIANLTATTATFSGAVSGITLLTAQRGVFLQQNVSVIANATGNLDGVQIQATGAAGAAAFMAFHRPSLFAAYFGLDTDNIFKVGGWSMGANSYKVVHEGLASATLTGNYTVSGTMALKSLTVGAATNANAVVEIGYIGGTNSVSGIDFHSSATAVDYDFRMLVSGNGGVLGTGTLTLSGAAVELGATALQMSTSGGLSMGSNVDSGIGSIAKHLMLYSTTYGLGITAASLNYVVPTGAQHNFVINGASVAFINATKLDAGALNITTSGNIQQGGVAIPFQNAFSSAQQTITSAGALTIAHGLGVKPTLYAVFLQCTTAELGYSIGDELLMAPNPSVSNVSFAIWPDATNLNIRFGSGATPLAVTHKTTGVGTLITAANWRLVARAWA